MNLLRTIISALANKNYYIILFLCYVFPFASKDFVVPLLSWGILDFKLELIKHKFAFIWCSYIVRKGLSPPHFKIIPHYWDSPLFLKITHPPTLLANRSSQVFLFNRNATVKLSSINTIHVKQQHSAGFFIFKFTLKYMLGNFDINKIHVTQCFNLIL